MSDREVQTALTAVQAQVAEDVAPIWGNEPAVLTLIDSRASFSQSAWQFIVAETPEQASQNAPGAAGDHDPEGGVPVGYAFVQITREAGMDPNVTISHRCWR